VHSYHFANSQQNRSIIEEHHILSVTIKPNTT